MDPKDITINHLVSYFDRYRIEYRVSHGCETGKRVIGAFLQHKIWFEWTELERQGKLKFIRRINHLNGVTQKSKIKGFIELKKISDQINTDLQNEKSKMSYQIEGVMNSELWETFDWDQQTTAIECCFNDVYETLHKEIIEENDFLKTTMYIYNNGITMMISHQINKPFIQVNLKYTHD